MHHRISSEPVCITTIIIIASEYFRRFPSLSELMSDIRN